MLLVCLITLFLFVLVIVASGVNDGRYKQVHDILGRKVEEARQSARFRRVLSQSQYVQNLFPQDGYVSVGHSFGNNTQADSTCASATLVSGIASNRCKEADGYWYSFQLFEDSCKGAKIHFFYDDKCTHLTGVSELESIADHCQVDSTNPFDHQVYSILRCTTTVSAAVPPSAYLINYYDGNTCSAPIVAFDAYVANTCMYMSKTQQLYINSTLHGEPKINVYTTNTNCKGVPLYRQSLSTVCLNDQQDDDHALLPFLDPPKQHHLSMLSESPWVESLSCRTVNPLNLVSSAHSYGDVILPRQLYALQSNSKSSISTRGVCIYPTLPDDDSHTDALSVGAIIGIVLGTLVGFSILLYTGYVAYWRYYGYAPIQSMESPLRPGTEMSSRLLSSEGKEGGALFELSV